MTKRIFITLFAGALLSAGAHATDAGDVRASQAWIRVLPGGLPAGGYVSLENTSDRTLTITRATSTRYGHAMIHRSSTDGGMGRMEMIESLALPPHATTRFAPGGYHVMLMDAGNAVSPGDKVKITFTFADGSTLATDFLARPANATGPTD